MKRGSLFVLVVIGSLFMLSACYSRHRYGYPDYRGGGYYGYDQIRNLADDLEDATDRVYDRADDYSGGRESDREDYALDRLEDLHEEAKDFKDEVEDRGRDPRSTRDDYRELVDAYYNARDAVRIFRDGYIYREFDRVSRIMGQLNRVYGAGGRDYGYRYPR